MRYSEIDNTYLSTAVARIAEGIALVTGLPVEIEIPEPATDKTTNSKWVLYVTGQAANDDSSDSSIQTWFVACQLIWKQLETKYDGTRYTNAHTAVPAAQNYLQSHKRLINVDGQAPVPYLQHSLVTIALADINAGGQAGFTLLCRLPFMISLEQEF